MTMQPPGTTLSQKNSRDALVGSYISTSMCTNRTGPGSNDSNDCGIHPRCRSTKPNFSVSNLTDSKSERNCSICARFSSSESWNDDSSLTPKSDSPPSNESNTWNRPKKFASASRVAIANVECPCKQPHSMTSPTGSRAAY